MFSFTLFWNPELWSWFPEIEMDKTGFTFSWLFVEVDIYWW